MKQSLIKFFSLSVIGATISFGSSCKKNEDGSVNTEGGATTEIKGCMDINAANYNEDATTTSNNCTFIKTTMYEVTYHAEFNEDGDNWDNFVNPKADIILRIKEQGASDWMFESDVINNHTHTESVQWSATTASVLKNKIYEWELIDDETFGSTEFMAGGTFNPMDLTNNENEIITTFTDVNGLVTQLKIYYFIQ